MGKQRIKFSFVVLSALLVPAILAFQPGAQAKTTPNSPVTPITKAAKPKATTTTISVAPDDTSTTAAASVDLPPVTQLVTTTAPATTVSTTLPGPVYHRGDFGITPGSGTFMQTETLPAALTDFKTLGVRVIRSTIPWQNIEPTDPKKLAKGQPKYNWKGVDAFLSILNSPKFVGQFRIIVTFENVPDWATQPANIAHISCPEQPQFDLQSYANAAAALAQHLESSGIRAYELENSPNIAPNTQTGVGRGIWKHANPCGYTQLLKKTYPAIHAVYPDARVLVGGIGGVKYMPDTRSNGLYFRMPADDFLQKLYDNGAKGFFDGVAYHPYSSPSLPCAPTTKGECKYDASDSFKDPYGTRNGWDRMIHAYQIMVAHGDGDKKIWATEYGAATQKGGDGNPVSEAAQAAMQTAALRQAALTPWLGPLCVYTYKDGNATSDHGGYYMGIEKQNGQHKLAYGAYIAQSSKIVNPLPKDAATSADDDGI